jgi:uncharacterized RmlC-like cupin family protein
LSGDLDDAALKEAGVLRVNYDQDEIQAAGFDTQQVLTSFSDASAAESRLKVDVPFRGVTKYQIPAAVGIHIVKMAPNSEVTEHAHPPVDPANPGGALRIVLKGDLDFNGQRYGPGDWFYVPDGTPYSFKAGPVSDVEVSYKWTRDPKPQMERFAVDAAKLSGAVRNPSVIRRINPSLAGMLRQP